MGRENTRRDHGGLLKVDGTGMGDQGRIQALIAWPHKRWRTVRLRSSVTLTMGQSKAPGIRTVCQQELNSFFKSTLHHRDLSCRDGVLSLFAAHRLPGHLSASSPLSPLRVLLLPLS